MMWNINNSWKFWKYEDYDLLCALLALWFIKGIEREQKIIWHIHLNIFCIPWLIPCVLTFIHFIGVMSLTHFKYQSVPFYCKTFVLESWLSFLLNKFQLSFCSLNPSESYHLHHCQDCQCPCCWYGSNWISSWPCWSFLTSSNKHFTKKIN